MEFDLAAGGLYLWCRLGSSVSPAELLRRSASLGISFAPGNAFYAQGGLSSHEIRLCFATHDEERLTEGIRRLDRALSSVSVPLTLPVPTAGRPII